LSWPTEEIDRKEKQEIWSNKNMSDAERQQQLVKLNQPLLISI